MIYLVPAIFKLLWLLWRGNLKTVVGLRLTLRLGSREDGRVIQRRMNNQDRQGQEDRATHRHTGDGESWHSMGAFLLSSVFATKSNCYFKCDNLSSSFWDPQDVERTVKIRPYNSCVTLKDTRQSVTWMLRVCVCLTGRIVCVSVWSGATSSWSWHCWSSSVPSSHGSSPRNDCSLQTHTRAHRDTHIDTLLDPADRYKQVLKRILTQSTEI